MMFKKRKKEQKSSISSEVALGLRKNRIKMSQKENGEDFFWDKNIPNDKTWYSNMIYV